MKLKESQQQSNRLSNEDLVPLGQEKRTWKAMNFASIWMGCIHNIPTYATVGGLIAIGLSPWQVLAIIITASLILFGALALNGHAGTKYGLPFPVIIRASYGIYGANIPALLRAFTAIMWLGIQTFAGSTALNILLLNMWPGWGKLAASGTFSAFTCPVCFPLYSFGPFIYSYCITAWSRLNVLRCGQGL